MVYETARWAVVIALLGSGASACACVLSGQRGGRRWWPRAKFLAYASLAALLWATLVLAGALLVRDFHLRYVDECTSKDLSSLYALSALWAGAQGSLLFWTLLLSAVDVLMLWTADRDRTDPPGPAPMTIAAHALLAALLCFFAAVVVYYADPFRTYHFPPLDGYGLKPELQNVQMFFHPPTLYLGYLGFAPAYALVVGAALVGGSLSQALSRARPWLLAGWTLLTLGILLGMQWAYVELGWGGYWAWDPVENASLIPWLVATGLLHVLVLVRRGALRPSAAGPLVVVTFALCLLGVALTRGGLVPSKHTFAPSALAWPLLAVAGVAAVPLGFLHAGRDQDEKPGNRPLRGQESLVALTAVIMIGLGVVVLGATWWPAVSALVNRLAGSAAEFSSLERGFFDRVSLPVGVFLTVSLWVCAAGLVRRAGLRWATAALLPGGLAAWYFLRGRDVGPVRGALVLVMGGLAAATVILLASAWVWSWVEGGQGRRRRRALLGVHLGAACLLGALTLSEGLARRARVVLSPSEPRRVLGLTLRLEGTQVKQQPTYDAYVVRVRVEGPRSMLLQPEQRLYRDHDGFHGRLAVKTTVKEDFLTAIEGLDADGRVALEVVRRPGVLWLWVGGAVMVVAGAALVIRRRRRGSDRGKADAA